MGYKPQVPQATKITYTAFPGLEVYATAPTFGELMDIADQKLNMNAAAEQRMVAFEMFSKYIKSWNVDHPAPPKTKEIESIVSDAPLTVCARCGIAEDDPLPTTAEHMMCLHVDFIMPVFFGWLSTVGSVDPTRYMNSNNGGSDTPTDLMRQLAKLQNPMPSNAQNWNSP